MGIKQLYKDNLRKLPNKYEDVSVMMASGPVALLGFKSLISVSISLAVQRIVDNEFSHLL